MSQFAQMNIFFIVTTLAVVVVAALVCVGLYYVIRILRSAAHISEGVEGEAKSIHSFVKQIFKKRS